MNYPVEQTFSQKVVAGPFQPFCCVELGTEYGRKTSYASAFHYFEYLFRRLCAKGTEQPFVQYQEPYFAIWLYYVPVGAI